MGKHSPRSRQYRQAREAMFARYGTVCHLCGHDGATEADHLDPVSVRPQQAIDPTRMRPAHGARRPCPSCGRRCNRERGATSLDEWFKPAVDW